MGIILGVLDSQDGVPQFCERVNDGVHRCDRRLRDVFVLGEDCVG